MQERLWCCRSTLQWYQRLLDADMPPKIITTSTQPWTRHGLNSGGNWGHRIGAVWNMQGALRLRSGRGQGGNHNKRHLLKGVCSCFAVFWLGVCKTVEYETWEVLYSLKLQQILSYAMIGKFIKSCLWNLEVLTWLDSWKKPDFLAYEFLRIIKECIAMNKRKWLKSVL